MYEWNTSPGQEPPLLGSTEPIEVGADYDESASWVVPSDIDDPPLHHLLVFTRDQGSAAYRQTDRYDLPSP